MPSGPPISTANSRSLTKRASSSAYSAAFAFRLASSTVCLAAGYNANKVTDTVRGVLAPGSVTSSQGEGATQYRRSKG